ncbi:MAG TPA: phosphotransferase [Pirellulales bacterium]|jgi:Ser/Thr protein kinase RdoA (MazF antagonist)|nr:phosphotransferase [Pirellulales bacterium]
MTSPPLPPAWGPIWPQFAAAAGWPTHVAARPSQSGFSSASLWKVSTPRGEFALRAYRDAPDRPAQLRAVHAALLGALRAGLDLLPIPISAEDGSTFLAHDGQWWELLSWLPGEACAPAAWTSAKTRAAGEALAQTHAALAESYQGEIFAEPSPNVRSRHARLAELRGGKFESLRAQLRPEIWPELFSTATSLARCAAGLIAPIAADLHAALTIRVRLQPCLRDVWHEHVLFRVDTVSGFIDLLPLQADCVATDLARLFGSLAPPDAPLWQIGLAAYSARRGLSDDERRLLPVLERSGRLLAAVNWLSWIYEDRVEFRQPAAAARRVREVAEQLDELADRAGRWP